MLKIKSVRNESQIDESGAGATFQWSLRFLPLLMLYLIVTISLCTRGFQGDEKRYVMFADNLSQGYYSPTNNISLEKGPGYPMVLVPFVRMKQPSWVARALNSFFLYFAVLYFYNTLRFFISECYAVRFAYLFGMYPPFLRYLHLLMTETLVILLMCGFLYHFVRMQRSDKGCPPQLVMASLYLGYLALTKVFYGYAILFTLLSFISLFVWRRRSALNKALSVYFLAFFFCMPYLVYTYRLTGKFFYWGTSGGSTLYWMTTPFQPEFGDWWPSRYDGLTKAGIPQLILNHGEFLKGMQGLNDVEWDQKLKQKGLKQLQQNPSKVLRNWLANVGRLLFDYPYSYTPQKLSTFFYIIPNMFVVSLSLLSIYPSYLARKKIPFELAALLLFGLISFVGSSMLSAYPRQFSPLVPIFALWITFALTQTLSMKARS